MFGVQGVYGQGVQGRLLTGCLESEAPRGGVEVKVFGVQGVYGQGVCGRLLTWCLGSGCKKMILASKAYLLLLLKRSE